METRQEIVGERRDVAFSDQNRRASNQDLVLFAETRSEHLNRNIEAQFIKSA
jgi:hypothetical protein